MAGERRVVLLRHGETDGNRLKVIQPPSIPLNANGHAQAAKVGARLAAELEGRIDRVICSDMDTAAPLCAAIGVEPTLSPLLQERNFGDLRGRKHADVRAEGINPFAVGYTPPNGESEAVFGARADQAWQLVLAAADAAAPGKVVVAVTHGLVLNHWCKTHVQLDAATAASDELIAFKNTSITVVDVARPDADGRVPVLGGVFNDDSHLSDSERDPDFASVMARV